MAALGVGNFDFCGGPKGEGHSPKKGKKEESVHEVTTLNRQNPKRKWERLLF